MTSGTTYRPDSAEEEAKTNDKIDVGIIDEECQNDQDARRHNGEDPEITKSGNGAQSGDDPRLIGNSADSREIAASYVARGWKPIPIQRGQKGPRGKDWQTRRYDPFRDFEGKEYWRPARSGLERTNGR